MDATPPKTPTPLQEVSHSDLSRRGIRLYVKRDDLVDPEISGNKWRKLRLNLDAAVENGRDTLLTFGGAHSNHLAATAAAAHRAGLKSIGVVRGEDADTSNPTLGFCREKGMRLHPVSRERYREKESEEMIKELRARFGDFHLIPEGGANELGVRGCKDILREIDVPAHRVFVACGTATTLAGMALANENDSHLYGVSALKGGGFLLKNLENHLFAAHQDTAKVRLIKERVHLLLNSHFGGYAKIDDELIGFMRDFYDRTGIKTDPVYTGKAAYAMVEMARRQRTVVAENWVFIHTGGMQGIAAMEQKTGVSIY